jgi:hypothetical protein
VLVFCAVCPTTGMGRKAAINTAIALMSSLYADLPADSNSCCNQGDYTYPMKEDVKKKDFSAPFGKTWLW